MEVTAQEAWLERGLKAEVPPYVREVVEEVAFQARNDRRVDKRSGVSQRLPISALETVVSNAERRALGAGEGLVVPRVTDLYERWVKAGPPPLGTPMARWWDRRLVELHEAIRPTRHDDGPTVREAAADDRYWDTERAGE